MSVESRATWSNGNRAAMKVIAKILGDDARFDRVKAERQYWQEVLRRRGEAFMTEARKAGLATCPYDAGFFITIPCEDPEGAGEKLQTFDIFAIPLGPGIRISVASNTVEECRKMPAKIKEAISI